MKAVIYARYSSDAQRDESIDGQIRECMEFAKRKEYTVIAQYIDRALSAKTDARPEFQHMIKDSEKGLFDTVIVWKLDRFSRNRYDSAFYRHTLKKNGVNLVSATESISDGPEGIILEALLEGMAEYYSVELKEKVERGHMENALKCKHNGGTTPYGYYIERTEHVLDIHPEQAPIVQEIFTKFDQGLRIVDIVNELNYRGIRCSYGKKFTKGRIDFILRNRKYIGEYKYKDVIVPGGIPAIVDKDLFERVNKTLEARRKSNASGRAKDPYLLNTKLFCGSCGRMMIGECGTSKYQSRMYYYYKCGGAKAGRCNRVGGVRKRWIENLAVLIAMDVVFNDETVDRIADRVVETQNKEDPKLPAMRAEFKDYEKRINNLLSAMEEGVVTASTRGRLEELERMRDMLGVSISQLELDRPQINRYDVVSWINKYRYSHAGEKKFQKQIIGSFINSIFNYGDRYVFLFNFQKGTKALKVQEVNEAFADQLVGEPPNRFNPKFVFLKTAFGFVVSKASMDDLEKRNRRGL